MGRSSKGRLPKASDMKATVFCDDDSNNLKRSLEQQRVKEVEPRERAEVKTVT